MRATYMNGILLCVSITLLCVIRLCENVSVATDLINTANRKVDEDFVEGDILGAISTKSHSDISSLLGNLWPNGVVPYRFDSAFDLSGHLKRTIRGALDELEDAASTSLKSCLQFTELKDAQQVTDYILIVKDDGCWSWVGKQGGEQLLSIGDDCEYTSVIMHEFMHAIGFFHEHTRPDRSKYVKVLENNIEEGMEDNFEINKNLNTDLPYDMYSIMHYSNYLFSKTPADASKPLKPTIVKKNDTNIQLGGLTLTDTDREILSSVYCNGTLPTKEDLLNTGVSTIEYTLCTKAHRRAVIVCPESSVISVNSARLGVSVNKNRCVNNLFGRECEVDDLIQQLRQQCDGYQYCIFTSSLLSLFGQGCDESLSLFFRATYSCVV